MRIAINTLYLVPGRVGGTETYVRGLLRGLSGLDAGHEFVVLTNRENHDSFAAAGVERELIDVPGRRKVLRAVREQRLVPRAASRLGLDVVHSPGYVCPLRLPCASVVTVHDMQYHYFPENFPFLRRWYWRVMVPRSVRAADRVIAVSEHARQDILRILGAPADKVRVTHEASQYEGADVPVSEETVRARGVGGRYVLAIGSFLPHKNFPRLVDAFALLAGRVPHDLVVLGMKESAFEAVRGRAARHAGLEGRILLPGYVPSEELPSFYAHADLFVQPSLFEGFGLPLLEAMTFGCPVAASNRTAIPEVTGEAAELFDPEDTGAMARAMMAVLGDEERRKGLVAAGRARVREFSWDRTARETVEVYEESVE